MTPPDGAAAAGWFGHYRPTVAIVVPCFNEAARLRPESLVELTERDGTALVLVDDGSKDDTLALLHCIQDRCPERVEIVALERNSGKAAAVRAGMGAAIAAEARWVGYLDADLAVPATEFLRLIDHCTDDVEAVLGSRVRLLGREIERRPARHFVGRIFATFASLMLGVPIYDTQCGGKIFRSTATLSAAVDEPFVTKWLFDVELLARLLHPRPGVPAISTADLVEVPLHRWTDVAGGTLSVRSAPSIAVECSRLERDVRRRRRQPGLPSAIPVDRTTSPPPAR